MLACKNCDRKHDSTLWSLNIKLQEEVDPPNSQVTQSVQESSDMKTGFSNRYSKLQMSKEKNGVPKTLYMYLIVWMV